MRRKTQPKGDPVIPPEILEHAKRSVATDHVKKAGKCEVCGAETSPTATDSLCWVCRRLKTSAWHDIEQQMPAQE